MFAFRWNSSAVEQLIFQNASKALMVMQGSCKAQNSDRYRMEAPVLIERKGNTEYESC